MSSQVPTQFTILIVPSYSAVGHVNPMLGVAKALKDKGHHVIIAIDFSWRGKLNGFEEINYHEKPPVESEEKMDPKVFWSNFLKNITDFKKSKLETFQDMIIKSQTLHEIFKYSDDQLDQIVNRVKPDAIILEKPFPSLVRKDIPWILLSTANPLVLPDSQELAPPIGSGLSVKNRDKWCEFRTESMRTLKETRKDYNDWLLRNGVPICDGFTIKAKYLHLYMYPEELDYTDIRPLGPEYFRVDALIKEDDDQIFEIPEKLKDLPGKLIFLSMGSMFSVLTDLMDRLISILSKLNHRFIISKGVNGDEYDLPANMWGENFLPQLKVLPKVDLFITHGGNNSVVEGLYFGKPMIILPLVGDQNDNGTRVEEKGLGYTFHPYFVKEEELNEKIDLLTSNNDLKERLNNISKKMKESKTSQQAVTRIEEVIKDFKSSL